MLAGSLLWVGALKFAEYEAENLRPMVSTSPLFSRIYGRLGLQTTARLVGVTEMALGALIAARPLSPRASAIGGLGATAMFLTTLSFMLALEATGHIGRIVRDIIVLYACVSVYVGRRVAILQL